GNQRVRNCAAFDLVDEFESRSPRQRLDLEEHFAELTRPTGLLLMPMMTFGLRRDRLAIWHAWWARFNFELELARHALEYGAEMQFAEASQHRLVRQRIVLGDERGILGGHFVEDVRDALLVAAAFWRNGKAVHRHRKFERTHVDLVFVVRIVQHAIEHDL